MRLIVFEHKKIGKQSVALPGGGGVFGPGGSGFLISSFAQQTFFFWHNSSDSESQYKYIFNDKTNACPEKYANKMFPCRKSEIIETTCDYRNLYISEE